jgi:redox-sensitive bicupin YhaK (pirin superfamily)
MDRKMIKRITQGQPVSDGAGVKLNRLIATPEVNNIDPFFLLDEFRSDQPQDYVAGFPMHPHRGIETITYMIEGSFKHTDSRGGGGLLNKGEVQWMTAGKGIQHEEMPAMKNGRLWGYQLWLNLPKKLKWVEPKYQHLSMDKIPVFTGNGMKVVIISGNFNSLQGPAENYVPSEYYDVYLEKGKSMPFLLKEGYHSLIYIHSGGVRVGNQKIEAGHLVEFMENNEVKIESTDVHTGFLFLSAIPNKEPYARGGPFVMNTQEEIEQAFKDYKKGRLF